MTTPSPKGDGFLGHGPLAVTLGAGDYNLMLACPLPTSPVQAGLSHAQVCCTAGFLVSVPSRKFVLGSRLRRVGRC